MSCLDWSTKKWEGLPHLNSIRTQANSPTKAATPSVITNAATWPALPADSPMHPHSEYRCPASWLVGLDW